MRRQVLAVGIVGVGLLLAGCTAGQPKAAEPGPATKVTVAAQIELPLTAYLATKDESELILRGTYRQQVVCAARFGLDVPMGEIDDASLQAEIDLSRRYGLVDLGEAKQFGYGRKPGPNSDAKDKDKGVSEPSQAEKVRDEVMTGKDAQDNPSKLKDRDGKPLLDGGCGKAGWDAVRGSVPYDWDDKARSLLSDAMQSMRSHPEFQAAERDWAQCMAKAGYTFQHRWDAGNSLGGATPERSKQMAVLDTGCALEVNFVGRAMAVDIAIQRQLIDSNEGALRGGIENKRKMIEQAKAALQ